MGVWYCPKGEAWRQAGSYIRQGKGDGSAYNETQGHPDGSK